MQSANMIELPSRSNDRRDTCDRAAFRVAPRWSLTPGTLCYGGEAMRHEEALIWQRFDAWHEAAIDVKLDGDYPIEGPDGVREIGLKEYREAPPVPPEAWLGLTSELIAHLDRLDLSCDRLRAFREHLAVVSIDNPLTTAGKLVFNNAFEEVGFIQSKRDRIRFTLYAQDERVTLRQISNQQGVLYDTLKDRVREYDRLPVGDQSLPVLSVEKVDGRTWAYLAGELASFKTKGGVTLIPAECVEPADDGEGSAS